MMQPGTDISGVWENPGPAAFATYVSSVSAFTGLSPHERRGMGISMIVGRYLLLVTVTAHEELG
jgi:hypothetical protein